MLLFTRINHETKKGTVFPWPTHLSMFFWKCHGVKGRGWAAGWGALVPFIQVGAPDSKAMLHFCLQPQSMLSREEQQVWKARRGKRRNTSPSCNSQIFGGLQSILFWGIISSSFSAISAGALLVNGLQLGTQTMQDYSRSFLGEGFLQVLAQPLLTLNTWKRSRKHTDFGILCSHNSEKHPYMIVVLETIDLLKFPVAYHNWDFFFFKGRAVATKGAVLCCNRGSDTDYSELINASCFYSTQIRSNEQNSFTKIFLLINSDSQENYWFPVTSAPCLLKHRKKKSL